MNKQILRFILIWNLVFIVPVTLVFYRRINYIEKYDLETVVYPAMEKDSIFEETFGEITEVKKCNKLVFDKEDEMGKYNYYCFKSNNKVYKVKFYFYTKEYESKKIIFEINGNIHYLDKDDIETNKE